MNLKDLLSINLNGETITDEKNEKQFNQKQEKGNIRRIDNKC